MISEDRLQKSLTYLAETDRSAAAAKAEMLGYEHQEKTVLGVEFLSATGTVAEREAKARTSAAYLEWRDKYEKAVLEYETLRTKRNTETLMVEVWRTLQANQRKGNI